MISAAVSRPSFTGYSKHRHAKLKEPQTRASETMVIGVVMAQPTDGFERMTVADYQSDLMRPKMCLSDNNENAEVLQDSPSRPPKTAVAAP